MRLIQWQKEKARAPIQRLLSYHVILFLLCLTLSSPAMALEASPPLVPDGEVVADMSTLVAQMTQSQPIRAAVLSPDGHTLVTGDQAGTVRFWEVATGRERRRLYGHTGAVWVVRVNPDGQMVATGGQDGTVCVWDLVTGQERQRFESAREHVRALDFSPDGTRLAAGDEGGIVRVWAPPGA
jgi:WD40 repeat protein